MTFYENVYCCMPYQMIEDFQKILFIINQAAYRDLVFFPCFDLSLYHARFYTKI